MVFVFRILSRLPLWLVHALGGSLGRLIYLASPTYRRNLQNNMAQAGIDPALRAAAAARRRKPRESTVDALVVATACTLPRPVVILTSDTSDIDLLLAADRTGATHGIRARRV